MSIRLMLILAWIGCLCAVVPCANAQTITPIAEIQANPGAWDGQVVTVEAQVYIPTDYRSDYYAGYIQDDSGRGIALFGDGANNADLFSTTNIVRVTGTVDLYFTTVEILDITEVTLLSSGIPPRLPQVLSTGAAASSVWEGTYIQVTGPITAKVPAGPAFNYTIDDGTGPIVVRVVHSIGAAEFGIGQTITARGAGNQYAGTFQVLVGLASGVFESGGPDVTPPTLLDVDALGQTHVLVGFSEIVTAFTAENTGNYEVFETASPATSLPVAGALLGPLETNVTLSLGGSLAMGVEYTVRVNNVQDDAGNTIAPNSMLSFTAASFVIPIAQIQADPGAYLGQQVTVLGQMYIPANYRVTLPSGYMQDDSGRGINLYGSEHPALFDVGNVVRVTGTLAMFFSTVQIEFITEVALVSTGNPPRVPQILSTGDAASPDWEGTYIEVTAPILAKARAGPGVNYVLNDGSGPIEVRVVDTLGLAEFEVGQSVTARGAGARFSMTFQILVGRAEDIFKSMVSAQATTWSEAKEKYR